MIHMGELIDKQLKKNGQTKVWLAETLGYERRNIYKLLKKPSMDSFLLFRISKTFDRNFFDYYYENTEK